MKKLFALIAVTGMLFMLASIVSFAQEPEAAEEPATEQVDTSAAVEEETVAIAQFNHDTSTGLVAARRPGTTPHKRNSHFVRADIFKAWKIEVGVLYILCGFVIGW